MDAVAHVSEGPKGQIGEDLPYDFTGKYASMLLLLGDCVNQVVMRLEKPSVELLGAVPDVAFQRRQESRLNDAACLWIRDGVGRTKVEERAANQRESLLLGDGVGIDRSQPSTGKKPEPDDSCNCLSLLSGLGLGTPFSNEPRGVPWIAGSVIVQAERIGKDVGSMSGLACIPHPEIRYASELPAQVFPDHRGLLVHE